MSERRRTSTFSRDALFVATLCAAAMAAAPGGAAARQVASGAMAEERARIQARFEALQPLADEAMERASLESQARREAARARNLAGLDTLRVGPLRVIVTEEQLDDARPHYEAAWDHYRMLLGGDGPETLPHVPLVYQRGLRRTAPGVTRGLLARPPLWGRPGTVQASVRRSVGAGLAHAVEPYWMWAAAEPVGEMPNLEPVYRELVTSRSATTRRCLEGDLGACWIAMGATGAPDLQADVELWYTPEQRRGIVRSRYSSSANPTAVECLELAQQRACDRLMTSQVRRRAVPLGDDARAALLTVAFEMGGPGSLGRFAARLEGTAGWVDPAITSIRQRADAPGVLAGGGDGAEQLRHAVAAASGRPADEVMAEWHRRVTTARPDRDGEAREVRLGSLFWILVFLAFSTRSTRWRLG